MKKVLFALSLLCVVAARAATVAVASTVTSVNSPHGPINSQVALRDGSGNFLPAGMRIRVGFFVGYTQAMDVRFRNYGAPFGGPGMPQFVPLGEPPVRAGYGDDTSATNVTKLIAGTLRWSTSYTNVSYVGASGDTSDDNTLADGGVARGTRLFVLVYNTGSLDANVNDPNFQYGLFSDASFVVPEAGSATLSLNVANVDEFADVYFGGFGSGLQTGVYIPEPAIGLMSLLAGAFLIARRRR